MSIKAIIEEALNEDPIAMKAAMTEELQFRIRDALETRQDVTEALRQTKEKITQKELNTALTSQTSLRGPQMLKIYEKLPKGKSEFSFSEIQDGIIAGYPFSMKAKLDLAHQVKKYYNMPA